MLSPKSYVFATLLGVAASAQAATIHEQSATDSQSDAASAGQTSAAPVARRRVVAKARHSPLAEGLVHAGRMGR